MQPTLVVMAAGRGSRFGGMKQVAEVGPAGESLFDYAVFDATRAGFTRFVFVVSEQSQGAVESHISAGCGRHVDVGYALQEAKGRTKPWGTGHAALVACGGLDGPFGVINADDFYGRRSFSILADALAADDVHHALVGFRLRDTLSPNGGVSRGVCRVDGDGFLSGISEMHDVEQSGDGLRCAEGVDLSGDELISTNLWGFRSEFCRVLAEEFERFTRRSGDDPDAEFLLGDAVERLPAHGEARVRVVPTTEQFLGVTYAGDVGSVRAELAARAEAGHYPSPLWP